jgi:hypothetical protein
MGRGARKSRKRGHSSFSSQRKQTQKGKKGDIPLFPLSANKHKKEDITLFHLSANKQEMN